MNANNLTTLVFNVGSSSVKYALYNKQTPTVQDNITHIDTDEKRRKIVQHIIHTLQKKNTKIDAIVHRVVHGGTINKTSLIDSKLLKKIEGIAELAPLHDIPEIQVIKMCAALMNVPQIAVFDTAFHQTMPKKAAMYPLPQSYYKKGIRRYGFHGTSHKFVTQELKGKIISCHLGSGCSLTAIKNGKSIENSMGMTPLDGLMMATRSGSIDPAIPLYIMKHEKKTLSQIDTLLNNESGLLGVSGISKDLKQLLSSSSPNAKLAVDMFVYHIVKEIGAYAAILNGVDHIVFCGGIGEQSEPIRSMICEQLTYLGIVLDKKENKNHAPIISTPESKVKVHVIPTNEELAMVLEATALISSISKK